jgi:hypothetical protein
MKERIDNIPYHIDSLTVDELMNIRSHLLVKHSQIIRDLERIDALLPAQSPDYESALGELMMRGEIDAPTAYDALGFNDT